MVPVPVYLMKEPTSIVSPRISQKLILSPISFKKEQRMNQLKILKNWNKK